MEINSRTIGGETPLHYAVTVGSNEVVNLLLKAGADPSVEAKRGTPLDLALGYPLLDVKKKSFTRLTGCKNKSIYTFDQP